MAIGAGIACRIGNQHRIHGALGELFAKRAGVKAVIESLREYRKERGLSRSHSER